MPEWKDVELEGTVYLWFAANDTGGSAADGATPVWDVRLGGAAAGAAPVLSGSATLLTGAAYSDGLHEVAIPATTVNGFAAGNSYGVFATLAVDGENPAGYIGGFKVVATGASLHSLAARFLGITSLGNWLRGLYRKDAMDATAKTEVNTGGGGYNETTDSQEAQDADLDSIITSAGTAAAYAIVNSGIAFRGLVSAAPGPNQFTIPTLVGLGAGMFCDGVAPYRAFVLRDAGGLGAAPQGETQNVTAYVSATGVFTTAAFTQPVAANDDVILMHPRIAELATIVAVTDKLDDTLEDDAGTWRFTENALEEGPTSQGDGRWPVAPIVHDDSGNDLLDAIVTCAALPNVLQASDATGKTYWKLDTGTYTFYVSPSGGFTPAASYTVVVNAAGAITSPAGGILVVTANVIPVPTHPDCYSLWDNIHGIPGGAALPDSIMSVYLDAATWDGMVDGTLETTLAELPTEVEVIGGQWTMDLPEFMFEAGAHIIIRKVWTVSGSEYERYEEAALVEPVAPSLSVNWSGLGPVQLKRR